MLIRNTDIADIFDALADQLEIDGENVFRIRAYRNAPGTVRGLGREMRDTVAAGGARPRCPAWRGPRGQDGEIRPPARPRTSGPTKAGSESSPRTLRICCDCPASGPERVHALHYDLDIHTPEQLYRAAKDGRLRALPGFGPKTEAGIVAALEAHLSTEPRFKLATAARYTEPLVAWLEQTPGVDRVVAAGSYRRCGRPWATWTFWPSPGPGRSVGALRRLRRGQGGALRAGPPARAR